MPAFAEGEQRHPPAIARIVASDEPAAAPHVGRRIHEPGGMQSDYNAQADAPEHHPDASRGQQNQAQRNQRNVVIRVQPEIKSVARQIRRIARHQLRVVVLGIAEDDPAHVRPEATVVGRVRIACVVGILMVHTMRRRPEDRPAFQRQRSTDGEEVFNTLGDSIRTMSMKPVIAHTDAETDAHPIQDRRNGQRLPGEHEQRANRAQMEENQCDTRNPIDLVVLARSRFHLLSP